MTSNQIAYWKNQEDIRANKAKEEETRRHNIKDEGIRTEQNAISKFKNELEAQGLEIKNKEALIKLLDWYNTVGVSGAVSLPQDIEDALQDAFGITPYTHDVDATFITWLYQTWDEFWRKLSQFGGGRGVGAAFF